jgi:hypothetical protein
VYAIGALELHEMEPEVRRFENAPDSVLRESVEATLVRLSPEVEESKPAFGSY